MPLETNEGRKLQDQLELLDYRVVEYALGCIAKEPMQRPNRRIGGRLPRHLKLAKLPDWSQRIRMRALSLSHRLKQRAIRERRDSLAAQDPENLRRFRVANRSPPNMTKQDLRNTWSQLCRGRRRRIPVPEKGLLPILQEKDSQVRDAGIKWYCGSFPGNPDRLQTSLGLAAYSRHKNRIQTGMQADVWSATARTRTIDSIKAFLAVMEANNEPSTTRRRARGLADNPPAARRRRRC